MDNLPDLTKRMTLDDILTWSVKLFRRDFWYYVKVIAVFFIPTMIVCGLIVTFIGLPSPDELQNIFFSIKLLYYFLAFIVYLFGFGLTEAASIKSIEGKLFGREMSLGEVARETLKRLIPLFLTGLLIALMYAFGVVVCFVAVAVLSVFLIFIPQSVMLDNKYYVRAIDTSFKLVTKSFMTVAVIILVYGLLMASVGQIVTLAIYIVPLIESIVKMIQQGGYSAPAAADMMGGNILMMYVINTALVLILQVFILPLQNLSLTLSYYNLKNVQDGAELIDRIKKAKINNETPK
jgi:hypothetical protein